jgi:hypothetical protein
MAEESDTSSSHSDYGLPSRGVLSSGKGWQGESMELEHARQSENKRGATTAVDLSQFRNVEIGKGYQAKFVVRQRNAEDDDVPAKVKDMTKKESKKERKNKRKRSSKEDGDKSSGKDRLDKYLQCHGLRMFRKELEKY